MKTADMVVIYENPTDYPQKFVSRLWKIGEGWSKSTDRVIVTNTLSEARQNALLLSPNLLVRFDRDPFDDACIVEVWM